jgi:nitroreductase
MIVDRIDYRTVRSAVELATRAPSVHNSQPWRWRIGDRTVHLYADLERWLPVTDAEGRDLLISLGAVLHHLRVALAASGLGATIHRFPNPDELDHVAAVELRSRVPAEADLGLAAAVMARRTDRRGYSDWEVPATVVSELIDRAAEQGATLRPMTAAGARARIEQAVAAAAAEHAELDGYHTETVLWTGRTASDDGVPAANLLRRIEGRGLDRSFPAGRLDQQELDVPDGGLLTVLGTASDDRLSQLRAGEALSAVVLHATQAGLATCPLSEVLEVEATRTALRDEVLDGTLSPQLLLRIGWAQPAPLPETPRLPVDATIDDLYEGKR